MLFDKVFGTRLTRSSIAFDGLNVVKFRMLMDHRLADVLLTASTRRCCRLSDFLLYSGFIYEYYVQYIKIQYSNKSIKGRSIGTKRPPMTLQKSR